MCGLVSTFDESETTLIQGWLRKKSHHLGDWRYRFLKFDGHVLKYWKSRRHQHAGLPPKGVLQVTGNRVVPFDECRLVILDAGSQAAAGERCFDEELLAKSREERDEWVQCLNGAVRKHRISVCEQQISTEELLRSKELWEVLEEAVAEAMGSTDVQDPSNVSAAKISEAALAHVRSGRVLLRLSEAALKPRHGRLVAAGRAVLQPIRRLSASDTASGHVESCDDRWLLLLSARNLSTRSSAVARRVMPYLEEPKDFPLDFEALHVYTDPMDDLQPFLSLPLLNCKAGNVKQCEDGHFWEVRVEEEEPGASTSRVWTMLVETKDECEAWQHAIETACKAARARSAGLRRTIEETLAGFDVDPAAWRLCMAECLADAGTDTSSTTDSHIFNGSTRSLTQSTHGVSTYSARSLTQSTHTFTGSTVSAETSTALAALDRVLDACDEVWREAEDILDAALQQQPPRRDVCEAVLEAALDPAVACVGRCWARWNAALSPADSRRLLRWLDKRRRSLHELGVVFSPLSTVVTGLAAELSLRMGRHLRRLTVQLVVREYGTGTASPRSQGNSTGTPRSSGLSTRHAATSTLPVDFFTMVFSCLKLDLEQDVLALRMSSQRVAKFVIYELTEVILGWLITTHTELARSVRDRRNARGFEDFFTPQTRQWLGVVAGLANCVKMLVSQCDDLDNTPLCAGDAPEQCEPGQDMLRKQALPFEWSLDAEKKRFEALLEAMLWAACDVATIRWRAHLLTPARNGANCELSQVLKAQLEAPLQVLRELLEPAIFIWLLPRVFYVCFGSYLGAISRGNYFIGLPSRTSAFDGAGGVRAPASVQVAQLSEQATRLCTHFRNIAVAVAGNHGESGPWESDRVLEWLRVVAANPGHPQQWRVPESGETESLRNILAVLSADPLDLRNVLVRFGGKALAEFFEEVPPSAPAGGFFVACTSSTAASPMFPSRQVSSPLFVRRRSEPQVPRWRSGSGPSMVRSSSVCEPKMDGRRSLKIDLFGRGREGSVDSAAMLSARASGDEDTIHSPRRSRGSFTGSRVSVGDSASDASFAVAGRTQTARCSLACEGGVCGLDIEDIGAYGMFCNVTRIEQRALDGAESIEDDEVAGSLANSGCLARRRWVQFSRDRPGTPAHFEVMRSCPSEAGLASTLEALTLSRLHKATIADTTELQMLFIAGNAVDEETPCNDYVCFSLRFDCPSHLFRAKRVLEDWWAPAQLPEKRPIVSLCSARPDQQDTAAASWGSLPSQLSNLVLETRLGTLWREVKSQISPQR